MKFLVCVCICIILLMFIIANNEKEIELVKLISFSIIFYFFVYIIISSIYFCLDFFTIKRVVITELMVLLVVALIMWVKCNKDGMEVYFDYKDWSPEVLVIIVGLIFASGSYGVYGMMQDEGVYQQKAITLMYGITDNEQVLPDYEEIIEGEYKDFYYNSLMPNLMGYDLNYDFNKAGDVPFVTKSSADSSEGVWHGIPVYPAILALSGKIFGMSHMADIHYFFFAICLCLIKFICDNLKINRKCALAAMLLWGLSPEVLWVTKSTLTEIFLSVIILTYIYFLTALDRRKCVYSVIPVCVFSFYHVSIYTMMPMFIAVYWVLCIWENEQKYIRCVYCILAGYYLGFWDMICLQAGYTLAKNYGRPLRVIPVPYIIPFITLMVVLGCFCNMFVSRYTKLINRKLLNRERICKNIVFIALGGMLLITAKNIFTSEQPYEYFCTRVWIQYAVLSGFVILPLVIVKLFFKQYKWNIINCIFVVMFIWSVAIYSTFLKTGGTYYYFGRYLTPYLSVIIFLYLIFYCEKWVKCTVVLGTACICILPQSYLVHTMKDDSRISWQVVEETMKIVQPGDTVVMDVDLMYAFYFPLRAIGSHVYPTMDSLTTTLKEINTGENGKILYLTGEANDAEELYMIQYRQSYLASEDSGEMRSKILRLPTILSYSQEEKTISLYQVIQHQNSYEIAVNDCRFFFSGWSSVNPLGNSWMHGKEESCIRLFLNGNEKYEVVFYTGDFIPFEKLDIDSINVSIGINDIELTTMLYRNQECFIVEIPKEAINNGRNILKLKSEVWSPREYGDIDERDLGISIRKIEIIESISR